MFRVCCDLSEFFHDIDCRYPLFELGVNEGGPFPHRIKVSVLGSAGLGGDIRIPTDRRRIFDPRVGYTDDVVDGAQTNFHENLQLKNDGFSGEVGACGKISLKVRQKIA